MKFNEFELERARLCCAAYKERHGYTLFSTPKKLSNSRFSSLFYHDGTSCLVFFNKSENGDWYVDSDYLDDTALIYRPNS